MQQDKQAYFVEDMQDTIVARLERLLRGKTVAEATADIADESTREIVSASLLSLYVDGLIIALEAMSVINHKQAEEMLELHKSGVLL